MRRDVSLKGSGKKMMRRTFRVLQKKKHFQEFQGELTWISCIKVLIQVSTIFWMRTCWFWFLQKAKMLYHSSSVVK